jgi:hypothetical protein
MKQNSKSGVQNIMFQVDTYEFQQGVDGGDFISKVKDTDQFIKLSGEEKKSEGRVARILIETGVLPKNESCEYLVDNENADAIYVDKDGKPFCELRKVTLQ